MENKEYIEIEGICYIRLSCCDPVSEQSNYVTRFWKHHDCGGDIYIGDNAYLLCKSCGETWPVLYSDYMSPFTANVNDFYVSQSKTFTGYRISLGKECIRHLGIIWLMRFIGNEEKQYERHYLNMKK